MGSSLNEHANFHCCIVNGVFAPTGDGDMYYTDETADKKSRVDFHAAIGWDKDQWSLPFPDSICPIPTYLYSDVAILPCKFAT